MHTYPIYLTRLHEKKTVIIGGNHEAERKVEELLEREANLTVISEKLTGKLKDLFSENTFEWIPRRYREGDLEGAFLVIAAEFEGDENERIYREAEVRGILVNVMDDIPHANFSFGSIVKRGPLTLSISTSGAAPTLAVRLRQRFEKEFGKEYATFLTLMQNLREPMKRHYDDFETRKNLWYELVDSDVLDLFRDQRTEEAIIRMREIVGREVVDEVVAHSSS
jgi:precorrin-2 dehydrogenase / sirohydrochlorin ferrochelatase